MRKIVMFNRITLDGLFAGPNGEIDWFVMDPEVDAAVGAADQKSANATVLFGGTTFEMFKRDWPPIADDPNAPEPMRKIAQKLNQMEKIVFSKSLQEPGWQNSKLYHNNLIGEVKRLKAGDGAGIIIFGSGTIVQQLSNAGLIDEYIFCVTPVILGEGKSLFKDVHRFGLELLSAKSFKSGNVLLRYKRK